MKGLYRFSALLIGCLLLPSGCGQPPNKLRCEVPALPNPQQQLAYVWKTEVGLGSRYFFSRLKLGHDENVLIVAERAGSVYALDPKTGSLRWLRERFSGRTELLPEAMLSAGVTLDDNRIWLGSEDGTLFCLDQQDGHLLWQANTGAELLSQPVIAGDLVLLCDNQYGLQAWDKQTYQRRWSTSLSIINNTPRLDMSFHPTLRGAPAPVVLNERSILVANEVGELLLLDLATGIRSGEAWTLSSCSAEFPTKVVHAAPLRVENLLYFIEYYGKLFAFSIESDQSLSLLFQSHYGSSKDLAFHEKTLYLVDDEDRIVALNRFNGTLQWKNEALLNRVVTAPLVYGDLLIVGDSEGYVYGFDLETGELQTKTFTDSSGLITAPIKIQDLLILHSRDGCTYAFKGQ